MFSDVLDLVEKSNSAEICNLIFTLIFNLVNKTSPQLCYYHYYYSVIKKQ